LNCDGFFLVPNLEHARHWVREGGNCSVFQSLLHVGHCLFIAVANALHHHPFLRVFWLGQMSSRSLNRSWLVINDWNRFCEDDAPKFRSSWMRPRVGVFSWHSNSSCSLLVFLSLVPVRFFCFLFDNSRTARHLLVRALPNSSIRIHCIPAVAWDTRVEVEFLVEVKFTCKRSLIKWGMVLVHSSSNHPSSTRSSISSLYFSSFLSRGSGRDVITSSHHCRVRGLLPAILIFLINNFSMEGNSVAASSSSLRIAWFISWISSRNVSAEVREVRLSSVLEFSLHFPFPPESYSPFYTWFPLLSGHLRVCHVFSTLVVVWERISRTISTTLPNRIRFGPKVPSYGVPQDCKGRQFELCQSRILWRPLQSCGRWATANPPRGRC